MTINALLRSTGSYLPEKILTNSDLEKIVETSDEWIFQRTGIRQRHIAADNETTADMAIAAARDAMANGNLKPEDIDGIIVATTTPDLTFPAVAVFVQDALGIAPCPAFDVQAVCSGFLYGLTTANAYIKTGLCKRMLVIGAEKMSSIVDWTDRTTCVLFADGAGAVVLEASDEADRGILSTHLYADGMGKDMLCTTGGTARTGDSGTIVMQGRDVFKHAVRCMSSVVEEALEVNALDPTDIDWLVPHQANIRIIEATAKKLNMSMDKVIVTVENHGNTSAASVPLALHEGISSGRIKKGDSLLLEAMGGGFTWGAAYIKY